MKRFRKFLVFAVVLSIVAVSSSRPSGSRATKDMPRRIRFEVVAFEERNGDREIVSETTIDGPAGTDFTINLHDNRFQMNAKFVTDLIASDTLKIKTDLKTRRLYGYSERRLPLYEEDAQKETMQITFDEKLVLLPFGRNDNNDQLKIEITPTIIDQSNYRKSGEPDQIEITIPKPSPGGAITVEASKVPHNYLVEATLLEDEIEVSRTTSAFHLDEPAELLLRPSTDSALINNPLVVNFTIYRYSQTGPRGQIAFSFSAYRRDPQDNNGEVVVPQAAGIGDVGSTVNYDLGKFSNGRSYKLNLTVRLAAAEAKN